MYVLQPGLVQFAVAVIVVGMYVAFPATSCTYDLSKPTCLSVQGTFKCMMCFKDLPLELVCT